MSLSSNAMSQSSFAEMYERWLVGPLFRPWAERTLDEVKVSPGDRLLDVACGTGIVARVARRRIGDAAHIVGVDISPVMLAVARAAAPNIDWREGDAGALPLRNEEQFDIVVCQQGLQFFPDKPAAMAQMRRALARGGKLAVATWRSDDEIPLFRDLRRVAERRLGPIADRRHSLGDAGALGGLLLEAGFRDAIVRTMCCTIRFDDGAPFLRLNTMALVGMSSAGRQFGEEERKRAVDAIAGDSAPVLQAYAEGSGLRFELGANLATASG